MAPFCSFCGFHRPCSYSLVSLVCIPAPFCSFYVFHRPCFYSLVSLVRILALSVLLMDCIDLSLTRNSHCCTPQLHFALFMHSTDLISLVSVIGADLSSICLLVLSVPQTLLSLFFCHCCASNLHSGLFVHSSDLALILNLYFCKLELYSSVFMHCIDVPLTLNSHYCKSELYFAVFMHSINLVVILRSDYCLSKFHSPPFNIFNCAVT